ncbi:MAG: hypothetical protein WCB67_13475 [Solirubrobacteraceae bacterium]
MRRTVSPDDPRPEPREREDPGERAAPGVRGVRLADALPERSEPPGETTGRISTSCSRAQMGQF